MLQSMGQRLSGFRMRKHAHQQGDAGFTLTEVIWALFLLSLVAMAALGLFLNGMTSVSDMQRQQAAASLAATALDKARAVTGTEVNSHGTSGLIKGRSQAAVLAQWDDLNAFDPNLTADMTLDAGTGREAWDVAPGMTQSDQWVPLRTTQTVDNLEFTVDTVVGLCYRLKTSPNLDQSCTQGRSSVDDAVMYRVRVVVRWDTGSGDIQTYTVSTLVDPSPDAIWNTALLPYAYDDEFTVITGAAQSFHQIVGNDTVDLGTGNPIWNESGITPDVGATFGKGTTEATKEGIFFTPPGDISGTVTFEYFLKDPAGQQSLAPATVTVHIVPSPLHDDFTVEPDTTTDLTDLLLDNDLGVVNVHSERMTTIRPFIDDEVDYFETQEVTADIIAARQADEAALAAQGITVGPNGEVFFEAPSAPDEIRSFSYYLVDSPVSGSDQPYPNTMEPATVKITTADVPLLIQDGDFDLDATSSDTWHDLDWRALTGNSDDVQIRIVGVDGGPDNHVRADGDSGVGSQGDVLEFRTTDNNLGVYEVTYVAVSPGGNTSEEAKLTVTVAPAAASFGLETRRNQVLYLDLVDRGTPNRDIEVTALGSATCGHIEIEESGRRAGQIRFEAPDVERRQSPKTCSFTYKLVTTTSPIIDSHDPATVTISVRR